jgi:hypothetical protein
VPVTRARAHDTACGDAAVTICRRWPPPHVVTSLSLREIEQRKVSPISPSSMCMARHRSALPFSTIEAMSVPTTSVRRPDPTLRPRAPPSCRGARRPHHRRPQLLLCALVASSPPSPFLRELTDNRTLRPSSGPVSASVSTTPPRSTSAPTPTLASPASSVPHRRSPTPNHHCHREPSSNEPPPRSTPQ